MSENLDIADTHHNVEDQSMADNSEIINSTMEGQKQVDHVDNVQDTLHADIIPTQEVHVDLLPVEEVTKWRIKCEEYEKLVSEMKKQITELSNSERELLERVELADKRLEDSNNLVTQLMKRLVDEKQESTLNQRCEVQMETVEGMGEGDDSGSEADDVIPVYPHDTTASDEIKDPRLIMANVRAVNEAKLRKRAESHARIMKLKLEEMSSELMQLRLEQSQRFAEEAERCANVSDALLFLQSKQKTATALSAGKIFLKVAELCEGSKENLADFGPGVCIPLVQLLASQATHNMADPEVAGRGLLAVGTLAIDSTINRALGVAGACEVVCMVMTSFRDDHSVMEVGLNTIANLAADERNRSFLGGDLCNACELVLNQLASADCTKLMAEAGLTAINNLAVDNDTNKKNLESHRAFAIVMQLLLIFSHDSEVVKQGLFAITSMTNEADDIMVGGNRGSSVSGYDSPPRVPHNMSSSTPPTSPNSSSISRGMNAYEVTVQVLNTHKDDPSMTIHVIRAVTYLANKGKLQLGNAGVCSLLVDILRNHFISGGEMLCIEGLRCMAILSIGCSANSSRLGKQNCQVLMSILQHYGNEGNVVLEVLRTIKCLCHYNSNNSTYFGSSTSMLILCQVILVHISSFAVAREGLFVFRTLSFVKLGNTDVCNVAIKILVKHISPTMHNKPAHINNDMARTICSTLACICIDPICIQKLQSLNAKIIIQRLIVDNVYVTDESAKAEATTLISRIWTFF